jgi:hypothetical protein
MEVTPMDSETFFCPLLSKQLSEALCQSITFAAEGRLNHEYIPEVGDWDLAKHTCADCVNAYWNRNNLKPPEFAQHHEE